MKIPGEREASVSTHGAERAKRRTPFFQANEPRAAFAGRGWGGGREGGPGRRRSRGLVLMAEMTLGRAWQRMSWFYYQYLLVTALYMLEPWERTVFNSMLISIVGMALYTGYIFMPQHILAILHYFEIVQ